MAAYVQEVNNGTTTSGNHVTTLTPAVGGLLIAVSLNTGSVADGTLTDDQGGTYTKITQALKAASVDKMVLWVRDQLVTSSVLFSVTNAPGATTGGNVNVYEISGMTRSGPEAIRQTAIQENQAAAGTPAPAFTYAALTGNLTLAYCANGTNPATVTEPTGWVERRDNGYATPPTGWETASRNSGFTGTTVTWGSTSASAFCSLIVELNGDPPRPLVPHQIPQLLAH